MGIKNDNQDITSEAPKLLLSSSIASASDPGSNTVTKSQAGIGKEHPELSWYYMYLSYKELKRYISVLGYFLIPRQVIGNVSSSVITRSRSTPFVVNLSGR